MKDIQLDHLNHDLDIQSNDLVMVEGIDDIVQNVKIRLWFFYAEWFLNTGIGMPYFTDILVKIPNLANIEAIVKREILNSYGVNEITKFKLTFDRATRKATIDFQINTIYGLAPPTQETL